MWISMLMRAAFALAMLNATAPFARATIIDFGSFSSSGQFTGTAVEDGYAYAPFGGGGLFVDANSGNPTPEMQALAALGGGVLQVRGVAPSRRFIFDAFDIAQRDGRPNFADTITVEGFLNNALVASEIFVTIPAEQTCCSSGSSGPYQTASPNAGLLGAVIDELRILLPGASTPDLFFLTRVDNISLLDVAEIPAPGTAVLMSIAFAGLRVPRWKSARSVRA